MKDNIDLAGSESDHSSGIERRYVGGSYKIKATNKRIAWQQLDRRTYSRDDHVNVRECCKGNERETVLSINNGVSI